MSAALTTVTKVARNGSPPMNFDEVTFEGPTAYPSGGTTGFEAVIAAVLGRGTIDLLAVIQIDGSGYVLRYNKGTDKLMIFESDNGGADGPLQETTTADLHTTVFRCLVVST